MAACAPTDPVPPTGLLPPAPAALPSLVGRVPELASHAIVARVALSWLTLAFPLRPGNPFYPLAVIIQQVTEPILAPMRRFLMIGMIDLSPLVAIVLLNFIQSRLDIALDGVVRGF